MDKLITMQIFKTFMVIKETVHVPVLESDEGFGWYALVVQLAREKNKSTGSITFVTTCFN